jgi:hypothetical protein
LTLDTCWQNSTNLLYSTIIATSAAATAATAQTITAAAGNTTANVNQHTTAQLALSYLHSAEATYESAKTFMAEEYLPVRKIAARRSELYAVFTGSDAEYSLAEAIQVRY